jgi:DNA primase
MSDIDEIKSRLNIVDLISARIPLKKAGRNFKALCPFHNEKSPSFIVSPDRQTFHCFGCGKGGSVFDWVMEYEHVDFVEALETLAEKAGVKLERRFDDSPQNKVKSRIMEANHLASEYYQFILTKHSLGEKARLYLKNRGVSDKTAATFALGYSPNSWDGLRKFMHKKGFDDEILLTAGLVVKSNRGAYDRFRGRVMFTLRDHRSNIVGFSGRALSPDAKEAKYINSPETPVYVKGNVLYGLDVAKPAISKEGFAILVEGEFDVISTFQEGISNTVAIKGSALTEGHINLLKRFTDRLIFALDADVAGDMAARRGIEMADRAGFEMKVITMPLGKDPDEAVRENASGFKRAIKEAVPIYDYFIDSALKRFDAGTAYGKKRVSAELLPMLAGIENPVVAAHYTKRIAEVLDVSESVIGESLRRVAFNPSVGMQPKPADPQTQHTPAQTLEIYILALLLQTKTADYFEELKEYIRSEDFSLVGIRRILEALNGFLSKNRTFLIRDFSDTLPEELHPLLDQAFLWDLSDVIDSEESTAKEWNRALRDFRKQVIKEKMKRLTDRMQSDTGEDNPQLNDVGAAIGELTDALRALEKSSVR